MSHAMKMTKDNLVLIAEKTDTSIDVIKETYKGTNPREKVFYIVVDHIPDGKKDPTWFMMPSAGFFLTFKFTEPGLGVDNQFTEVQAI
jgi:hypothetical protein